MKKGKPVFTQKLVMDVDGEYEFAVKLADNHDIAKHE